MATADPLITTLQSVSAGLNRSADRLLHASLGIGLSQYRILQSLQTGTQFQQRQIAVALGQTEASVSRQVKLLVRGGLITIRPDPQDRRRHHAALTREGRQLVAAAGQLLAAHHKRAVARLSPRQQQILLELLAAVG